MRALESAKGGEPTVEHQKRPGPAEFTADRPAQHPPRPQALDRVAPEPRVALHPPMYGQPEPGLRSIEVSRRQARLHEPAHEELAAAAALIDQQCRIDAQHE